MFYRIRKKKGALRHGRHTVHFHQKRIQSETFNTAALTIALHTKSLLGRNSGGIMGGIGRKCVNTSKTAKKSALLQGRKLDNI